MNRYERNKHLKEAIVGWVTEVFRRIKAMKSLKALQLLLERMVGHVLKQGFERSAQYMQDTDNHLLPLLLKKDVYGLGQGLGFSIQKLEDKIKEIFEAFDIDLGFLQGQKMTLLEFAGFIIELANVLTKRARKAPIPADQERAVIEEEIRNLILTRYTTLEISVVPQIVEQFGSVSVILQVAVRLRTVLSLDVVSNAEESASFSKDRLTMINGPGDARKWVIEKLYRQPVESKAVEMPKGQSQAIKMLGTTNGSKSDS